MGRRIRKKVFTGSAGNWTLSADYAFVYDNFQQIEKIDLLNNNTVVNKRIWSAGNRSGANRILCDIHSASGTDVAYYALADANKNITEYFDSNGNVVAHYEYSPFGKITQSSGTMASDFDYRFSSEAFDSETNLVYYNYRYYSAELGRWLSRDPSEESGGNNLYGFVVNQPINKTDRLGLSWWWPPDWFGDSDCVKAGGTEKDGTCCCGENTITPSSNECCVNGAVGDWKDSWTVNYPTLWACVKDHLLGTGILSFLSSFGIGVTGGTIAVKNSIWLITKGKLSFPPTLIASIVGALGKVLIAYNACERDVCVVR